MTATRAESLAAPFRGLAPFGESELDALLFFGRERETEIAVANLLASRLTVLYGPSGVGKTSLLRAGVARRVRELAERRALGRGPDAAIVVFSDWAGDPLAGLSAALGEEVASLTRGHAPGPAAGGLADVVEHWSTVLDGELYIVLDQLEEYFVYHGGEAGGGILAAELPEVVLRPRLRGHVLLSLRDDALARLDVLKDRIPSLYANVLRLDRLDRAAATAAILGPVSRFNELVPKDQCVGVEPALVEAVLAEASVADEGGSRVEPPYLQLVMERLWDEEAACGSHLLRASTLAELGGAVEIVRAHLDRAVAVLGERDQDAAALMFEHLVTPSGTKIAHRASDLAQFAKVPADRAGDVLAALGKARILRAVDDADGGPSRYEIFHDVLAGAVLRWRHEWELEHERAAVRRHRRRLVEVVLAAVAALLVMAAVTGYALSQRSTARDRARSADARALATSALLQLDRDPELSLLLARQAASLTPSPLVEDVLRRSILASRVRRVVPLGGVGAAAAFVARSGWAVGVTTSGRVVVADAATGARERVVPSGDVGHAQVLLDPTGRRLLLFGLTAPPQLVSVRSGARLVLPSGPVRAAAFAADGTVLAAIDRHGRVDVLDAATGRLLRALDTAGKTSVVAVSADGTLVAAAVGSAVVVAPSDGGPALSRLRQPSVVTRLAFGPGGRVLAVGEADKTVRVMNVRTRALLAIDGGQRGAVTSIAFSPRGTLLAVANTDGVARIWTVAGELQAVLIGHTLGVSSAVFSPDGWRVATTSADGTARVWDALTGDPVAVLAGHGAPVASAAFSADGRSVVTAGLDGTMRVWNAISQPTLTLRRALGRPVEAARPTVGGLAVAPVGATDLSVSVGGTRTATTVGDHVLVADVRSGARLAWFRVPSPRGVALAPDGRTVAVAEWNRVRIYGLDGVARRTLRAGRAPFTRLAFSPDGRRLAAGATNATAVVWDIASGSARVLRGHTDDVLSVRFDPTGSELATAGRDHVVIVWQVATGRRLRVLRGHFGKVSDVAFSPDGRWIVTAGPGKAGLWDASSGELLFYLQGHRGALTSASFGGDGKTIVTSGVDGTVRSYRCDVCVGLGGLERIADARLAATHRRLTTAELRAYAG